jgi:ParB-like chromosome segregation protein Spo0J
VSAGASVVREKNAALTVEWRPLDALTPYPQNARVLSSKAVAKVAASIKAFGWRQPIVVDAAGVIIAGHTRLLAAQSLGLKAVPVLVADDLTPAQVRAYRLADNRTAQEASWDIDLLTVELGDLSGLDIDLSLTGFDAEELNRLTARPGLTDPDTVPEPRYCDAIVTRWQKFTGRKAVCRGDS